MYAGQQLVANDGYEVCLYPMTTAEITQSYAGSTSHRCTNITNTGLWDVIGHSGAVNQSNIYAPFSGTITVQQSSGNQRVLSSSNKVHLANGSLEYANFGWGHDNQLLVNIGDYVVQGQLIGYTGNKDAYAIHSHWMLGTGEWTRGNSLPLCSSVAGYNIFYMPNAIDIDDMFYVNNTTVYTGYIDGLTLNWRTWDSPTPSVVTITTAVSPSGAGYVTGGGTYNLNANVSLTAYPNSGHVFKQWSTGETTQTINFRASRNMTVTAYFDDAPVPPTPIEPEEKVMTISPTSKSVFIDKEGTSFTINFTMSGTPDGSEWNWYPDVIVSSNNISLESSRPPWNYSSYTGQDGNTYILTTATFICHLDWIKSLGGESGRYTITFTRYNQNWTAYDLTQTLTIYYEYVKGDAVLFLQYDGGTVEIR